MSQLNVDTIKNRLGTAGPTLCGNVTVSGNLTVDGTQTVINTQVLDIADKTVGIASTSLA